MADLLASALEHSPESVSIYGLDSTVLFMNPVTERIMGVSFAEVRGKRLFELYRDAVGTPFHDAFVAVASGAEPQVFQHYYPRFDGWFANHVVRIGDHVHVYTRDVTEDVRRQRRLDALARISEVLTRGDLDRKGTAQAVTEAMADVLEAESTIALLSPTAEWLDITARASNDPVALALVRPISRWRAQTGSTWEALRSHTAILELSHQIGADQPEIRHALDLYQPTSVVIAPLMVDDTAIGVLAAARRAGKPPLTEHDRLLLAEIAPSIALYLSNADRRAEAAALRVRLTALADALPMLASFLDKEERYLFVNAQYERWFGRSTKDYIGRTAREMLGDAAYATMQPYFRTVLAGTAVHFRVRIDYPNGGRDVDAHCLPIFGPDGRVDGFVKVIRDISSDVHVAEVEREHREAERRSAARLQRLLELSGSLAGAQTPDDIVRELVDSGAEALEAASVALWRVGSDGSLRELVRERRLMTPAQLRVERVQLADYAFVVELDASHARMPDERAYLEILASNGAEALRRARALDELHDISELQAAMIDASPTAIILLDAQGIARSWNRAAERIFGWSADEMIGHAPPMIENHGPEFTATLARVMRGEVVRVETRREHKNGETIDLELYAAPVRRGSETLCLMLALDISERRLVERAREQALADANRARTEAEAASRSKDEFLAMLGHELRNPLAPLVTALELMRMKDNNQFARERAVLTRQVQHLSRLVDDLLDVSRITRGKIELRRERVTLADVVAKAVEQTSPLFDERRHHLTLDVAPDLVVNGDPTRLAQVVSNLLSNAAKYTPRGGRIAVTTQRVGDSIRIAVRDNGIGIASQILPHVFDLFVQAPQSSERPAGGLGLGLTIVRSLVDLHGGTVNVTSEGLGKGSEFVITLPSAGTHVAARTDLHVVPSHKPPSSLRVLVVDDNEDAATLLADLLDAHGHDIRTAFDGPSALRIADEFHPDVAVLDIGLPVMDGYELAERLRSSPALHDMRLIAVTGYGQESDKRRSLEAGFEAHLAKPVEIDTLVQLVEHS